MAGNARTKEQEDLSQIRRQNIKTVIKHGDLKILATELGCNSNYLSQIFSHKSPRLIGDKMVRHIERVLSLAKFSLDVEEGELAPRLEGSIRDTRSAVTTFLQAAFPACVLSFDVKLPFDVEADVMVMDSALSLIAVVQIQALKGQISSTQNKLRLFGAMQISRATQGLVLQLSGKECFGTQYQLDSDGLMIVSPVTPNY